ncbi:hypothetical protein BRAS3809_560002 [Bradyrhizobium sp. STM 3809]|nr:hypothetical protein BRAS3809_560002 [Bradyrhizobium sp. STM 3809]
MLLYRLCSFSPCGLDVSSVRIVGSLVLFRNASLSNRVIALSISLVYQTAYAMSIAWDGNVSSREKCG